MHNYFLLTYSVDNVGYSTDERIAKSVRDRIAALTLEDIKDMDSDIAYAVDHWEKHQNVETAISGMMWFEGEHAETDNDKKAFARKILRAMFRNILRAKNATQDTTIIECAMMIDGTGETFTFKITPRA